jgi:hypothetical protein
VEKIDRRPEDEGHRGQAKRSTRTGEPSSRKSGYTATSGAYSSEIGLVSGICGSRENEGSSKFPSRKTMTNAWRSNESNWRVGHFSREFHASND